MKKLYLLGTLCALTAPLPAQTPDTVRLSEVVVTATKVPLPRRATTAALTVLHGDELRERGLRTVADALRHTPGAAVVQVGSLGGITSLFLRGGESDYVQVLIDGVRANQPGGVFDFADLTLDNIDRIEIVRGPASVLYGSDAVTGVIQVFTRRPGHGTLRLRGSATGGNKVGVQNGGDRYATTALAAEATDRGIRAGYTVGVADTRSDGLYAFNNRYRNSTASARVGIQPGSRTTLDWTARLTDARFHYPTDGTGKLADRNQYRTTEAATTGIDLTRRSTRLTMSARAGMHQTLVRYIDDRDGPGDTTGIASSNSRGRVRRSFAELSTHYALGAATTLSGGAEVEQQVERSRYAGTGQFGPFSSRFGKTRTNRGAYVQGIHRLAALSLNGGLRADFNDRFGDFITYRAGAAYTLGRARLRAAAGTAFKEPTFFENYAEGFTKGNPALEPEQARTLEAGVEVELTERAGAMQATAFRQRFRNLIQYVQRETGSVLPNYKNVSSARADGIELEWNAAPFDHWNVRGSFTWLDTETLAASGADAAFQLGQPLLRRPRRQGNLEVRYTAGRFGLDAQLLYVGSRTDLDFASFPFRRVQLDAYHTVGGGLTWRAAARSNWPVALSARIENFSNRRIEEVRNFPGRGRTLYLGLETNRRF